MSSEHLPHYEEDQDPGTALLGRIHAKMLAIIRFPYRIRDEPETIDLSSDTENGVKPATLLLRPPIEYPRGDEPFTMRQHYMKLFIDEFYEAINKGDTGTIDVITRFELKGDTIGADGITPLLMRRGGGLILPHQHQRVSTKLTFCSAYLKRTCKQNYLHFEVVREVQTKANLR